MAQQPCSALLCSALLCSALLQLGRALSCSSRVALQGTFLASQPTLRIVWAWWLQPRAKLVFSTSTPVPVGDGGGSRTEAHVLEYNSAARAALPADVVVNDLHGAIVSKCGAAEYGKTGHCELQVPNGVHYEYEGRQYGALSVVRAILRELWEMGK
eukprot:COSAG06_NODE_29127_length_562_cov_0.863931_1_plen_156_part_00